MDNEEPKRGRGRPKGTTTRAREEFIQMIRSNGKPEKLITKLMELAEGVTCSKPNPVTGKETIYSKPPDVTAIIYLLDQGFGKPKQAVEMSGADGDPIKLTIDLRE